MNTCQNKKLEIQGVSKAFSGNEVLQNIDMVLREGEIVSLIGTSGAGKTTLFHIISGLLAPDVGGVSLDGADITNQTGKVSYMLQKDLLLPHKTVIENIALPLLLSGTAKKEAFAEVQTHLDTFGLSGYESHYPNKLSGGMRQRAALLRTYLCKKGVALLDEPFSALDTITKTNLQQWYLDIMEEIKLSTIFITHDIDEAIFLSDRVYILSGKPATIIDEIVIDYEGKRTQDFLLTTDFLEYKRRIKKRIESNL
ncbi:MAG: ABC transporter ATP-binding protein [Bacillota bacterium]